ncbi:MAG TPA: hypothetical protein VGA64_01955 [Candidatus Polarisedimenticolia bacterium]
MERHPRAMTAPARIPAPARTAVARFVLAAAFLGLGPGMPPARAAESAAARRPPAPPAPANPETGRIILQWDHLVDSNDRTFEDYSAFVSYKQSHFQLWQGEFTKGGEIGGFLRDHRKSTYSGLYRYREGLDHVVQLDTEQVLEKGFVLAGMVRGIRAIPDNPPDGRTLVQAGAGFDWYHGDYGFLSFRAIDDPRAARRWSFIASHRFQRTPAIFVQPGLIVRTDRSTGWFLQGKVHWFRWGVGKYDRFDFTDVDRTIYSAAVELTY